MLETAVVLSWIVPVLMSVMVGILGWMAQNIHSISKSLAVVVYRVDNHEERIDALEQEDRIA